VTGVLGAEVADAAQVLVAGLASIPLLGMADDVLITAHDRDPLHVLEVDEIVVAVTFNRLSLTDADGLANHLATTLFADELLALRRTGDARVVGLGYRDRRHHLFLRLREDAETKAGASVLSEQASTRFASHLDRRLRRGSGWKQCGRS
jgi:hypothetical protein